MNKSLAINGGRPIRKDKIPIHIPVIDAKDIAAVSDAIKSISNDLINKLSSGFKIPF